jgi:hypothetical protein
MFVLVCSRSNEPVESRMQSRTKKQRDEVFGAAKNSATFSSLTVVFKGLQLLIRRGLAKLTLIHWTWPRALCAMRTTADDASDALRMHSTCVELLN